MCQCQPSYGTVRAAAQSSHEMIIIKKWEKVIPEPIEKEIVLGFIQAFGGAPRYEVWSETDVEKYYRAALGQGGVCLTALEDSRVLGVLLSQPLASWYQAGEVRHLVNLDATSYLNTVFVMPDSMRTGIGRALVAEEINRCRQINLSGIVARTRTDSFPIMTLLQSLDFKIILNTVATTQGVTTARYLYYRAL
jgi:GNAT superfamily N-acetyltransferase